MFLQEIYNSLLYVPLVNLLLVLYHYLFSNMGLAIIAMTVIIKLFTYPLTKPSLEAAKKQRELMPQLEILKKKYKNKQVLAQKQMDLYKANGVNPVAGCLPQIVQIFILIALYRVFLNILNTNGILGEELLNISYFDFYSIRPGEELNTSFLWLNLAKADQYYIIPVLAAASQFFMSKFMSFGATKVEDAAKKTPDKEDDFMVQFQKQSMYIFPFMTLVIGLKLPSGLVLYWCISTLLAVVQYIILNRKDKKYLESIFSLKFLPQKNDQQTK